MPRARLLLGPLVGTLVLAGRSGAAPLSDHFGAQDVEAYAAAAVAALEDASSVADMDYSAQLLERLGKGDVAAGYKGAACAVVARGVVSEDLSRVHHGLSLGNALGCGQTAPDATRMTVTSAFKESSDDLPRLIHVGLASKLAGMADEVEADLSTLVLKAAALITSDGSSRSAEVTSVEAAELLGELAPLAGKNVKGAVAAAMSSLKGSGMDADPMLIAPVNAAAGGKPVSVKPSKLKAMSKDLLDLRHTRDLPTMLRVYRALQEVANYPKSPVTMALEPAAPCTKDVEAGSVCLKMLSILGAAANAESVTFNGMSSQASGEEEGEEEEGGGYTPPSPVALSSGGCGEGGWALPAVSVAAGVYTVEFGVKLEGEGKDLAAKLPLSVSCPGTLSEVVVAVSDSQTSIAGGPVYRLPSGEVLPEGADASAMEGEHLHVSFVLEGAGPAPHQTFVRFTHALTGLDTYFMARPEHGSAEGRSFRVVVSLADEVGTFLHRSGVYLAAVLAGGELLSAPVLAQLGHIDLDFPEPATRDWPLYARPLLHESDVTLTPLLEKHHTFRSPEDRPAAAVSLAFTLLVLAPLGLLVVGLKRAGAGLHRLPGPGEGLLWCIGFQACLAGVLGLFGLYWLALTMAATLQALVPLLVVTVFTGRRALMAVAAVGLRGSGGSKLEKID